VLYYLRKSVVSDIVFMCWRHKVEQFLNKAIRNINQREAARHVCMENSAIATAAEEEATTANEKRHKVISDFHSRETR